MIKKLDGKLPQIKEDFPTAVRIAATHKAYGALPGYALYSQSEGEKSCLISCLYGNAVIDGQIANAQELVEFLRFLCQTVFCSLENAKTLGLSVAQTVNVMVKAIKGNSQPLPEYPPFSTRQAYNALALGEGDGIELPDYETFAADFALRCRRGAAGGVVLQNACALCFNTGNNAALLGGVAVSENCRKSGLGKRVVEELCGILPQKALFVCCLDSVAGFYEKCGFSICGQAALCEL